MSKCACGSEVEFGFCCDPLLKGSPALSAEALIRSRYTALAIGNLDHVEATCTEIARETFDRGNFEASLPQTEFLGLDIRHCNGNDPNDINAEVTFRFRYQFGGRDFSQTEIARCVRSDRGWLYDGSEINPKPSPVRVTSFGRNDPCPCASGRKYKKCCGVAS